MNGQSESALRVHLSEAAKFVAPEMVRLGRIYYKNSAQAVIYSDQVKLYF